MRVEEGDCIGWADIELLDQYFDLWSVTRQKREGGDTSRRFWDFTGRLHWRFSSRWGSDGKRRYVTGRQRVGEPTFEGFIVRLLNDKGVFHMEPPGESVPLSKVRSEVGMTDAD